MSVSFFGHIVFNLEIKHYLIIFWAQIGGKSDTDICKNINRLTVFNWSQKTKTKGKTRVSMCVFPDTNITKIMIMLLLLLIMIYTYWYFLFKVPGSKLFLHKMKCINLKCAFTQFWQMHTLCKLNSNQDTDPEQVFNDPQVSYKQYCICPWDMLLDIYFFTFWPLDPDKRGWSWHPGIAIIWQH